MTWPSFQRARRFGPPSRGAAALVWISAILAATTLVKLLLLLAAGADLVVTRGMLVAEPAQTEAIARLAGPPDVTGATIEYHERGLLPLVWRLHDTRLGRPAEAVFAMWPSLGHNQSCLRTLVVSGWIASIAYALLLYMLEWSARLSARNAVRQFRLAIFQQSTRLGAGDLLLGQKQNAPDLFEQQVETLSGGFVVWRRAVPHAVLALVLLAGLAACVEVWLALAAILLAVLSRLMLEGLRNYSRRRGAMWADLARQQCATLLEDLRQVRSLGDFLPTAGSPGQSFNDRLRQCHAASLREHTSAAVNGPAVLLFVLIGAWLILLLGGMNVLNVPPRVSVSGIVLLGTSLLAMAFPLRQLWQLSQLLPAADAAAGDILAYLDRQPAVGQIHNAQPLPRPTKQLALVNVTVANAAGDKLLNDVSLAIPCGSATALVASDPESLLALTGLLPRFYDPAAGRILFDGFDIGRATLASVRAEVAVLMPERILVTGSVTENITGGDPRYSTVEVTDAARRVFAYDFVQRLPHGFDTIIGDHGQHLTVAEAMLIGMARVLLRNPAVAIIGEAPERPDSPADERLAAAMQRVAEGRTLIVLARRLQTLRAAERILLFHDGKLHAEGSHVDLLAESELYRHLNYVRFNEFRNQVSADW